MENGPKMTEKNILTHFFLMNLKIQCIAIQKKSLKRLHQYCGVGEFFQVLSVNFSMRIDPGLLKNIGCIILKMILHK